MIFKELKIGQVFEFAQKSEVGGGMWNGKAIKRSENTYAMMQTQWIPRVIGNVDIEVNFIGEMPS